jgi:DNA-binding IclR family transcriptional regulator
MAGSTTKTSKDARRPTPPSETVVKTLALLDLFTTDNPTQTASEIARTANLPLSTAFRLLTTLVQLNFVEIDRNTRKYRLGLKLLELGHVVTQQLDLPALALPILHELRHRSSESARLSIRDGMEGVFISKVETLQSVRLHTPLGQRVPLHAGASMKILLAFQPEEDIADYIKCLDKTRIAPNTIIDPDKLQADLARIREQGYAASFSEQSPGAAGVAAPVRDHTGRVVAGITISGPEPRFTPDKVQFFAKLIVEAAANLSAKLGAAPALRPTGS